MQKAAGGGEAGGTEALALHSAAPPSSRLRPRAIPQASPQSFQRRHERRLRRRLQLPLRGRRPLRRDGAHCLVGRTCSGCRQSHPSPPACSRSFLAEGARAGAAGRLRPALEHALKVTRQTQREAGATGEGATGMARREERIKALLATVTWDGQSLRPVLGAGAAGGRGARATNCQSPGILGGRGPTSLRAPS